MKESGTFDLKSKFSFLNKIGLNDLELEIKIVGE